MRVSRQNTKDVGPDLDLLRALDHMARGSAFRQIAVQMAEFSRVLLRAAESEERRGKKLRRSKTRTARTAKVRRNPARNAGL